MQVFFPIVWKQILRFDEIELFGPKHVPGGTVQNTAMVFQWIISRPNCFTVLGTVGQDIAGEELTKKLIDNGVIVNYEVVSRLEVTNNAGFKHCCNGKMRCSHQWAPPVYVHSFRCIETIFRGYSR